jgi:hypothetical protein
VNTPALLVIAGLMLLTILLGWMNQPRRRGRPRRRRWHN